MQTAPTISVVIPVKNGAPWLNACLTGILNQSVAQQTEIIVLDSGSTDGSLDILKAYPVRLFSIPSHEFNHGLTRQFGAEKSRGRYVVMTVQDAVAHDDKWIEHLLSGFSAAENVAGVCGSQIVYHSPENNPVEWHRPRDLPKMDIRSFASPDEFDALTPFQKMMSCSWDDVTAMYRRDVLLQIPFRKTSFGEDALWAKDALRAGYTLVYNNAAKVRHFHYEDFDYAFRRNLTVMYMRYKLFGCIYNPPKQSLKQTASIAKAILWSRPLTGKQKWHWWLYNQMQFGGRVKAYKTFSKALAQGEEKLDAVHEEICGQPPLHQAKQKQAAKQAKK